MSNLDGTKFAETIIDNQKKVVDSVTENAKKFANGNNVLNETIEKGSEWYKNWLEGQKNFFTKTTEKGTAAAETVKESATKMNEFYENWLNQQNNWTKQMAELNQEWTKNFTNHTQNNNANPLQAMQNNWSNWQNNLNNWMTQNATNNWMNQMQQNNPFNMGAAKNTTDNWTNFSNQYQTLLNDTFAQWQKSFKSGTIQDAFKGMTNVNEGFQKFAEMMMPMFKSIQDKTFNMDVFKQMVKPELYKELMDKFFGFMPESSRNYMQQMSDMMKNSAKQFGASGMDQFHHMRQNMGQFGTSNSEMFGNMMNGYNTWNKMMNDAAAPFTKMMTETENTKTMQEWADLANRITVYNIKNAELQFMVYNQGSKVMDKLAENIQGKMQDGKEVTSMLALYQEWLNIGDKVFVNLFESDEYSKLMAEVSAMQMTLKKDISLQMEKFMTSIPVATRSEMDEVYKTVYELKSQIRQLEKMMGAAVTNTAATTNHTATETKDEVKEETATDDKGAKRSTAKKA